MIRKKGKADVNSDVNGVALAVKGKREENRDKCEDYEGKNEREIRRLDNERESEKRVEEVEGREWKKRKVGYWEEKRYGTVKTLDVSLTPVTVCHRRHYFTLYFLSFGS